MGHSVPSPGRLGKGFPVAHVSLNQAAVQGMERCRDPRGEVAKNFRVRGFTG